MPPLALLVELLLSSSFAAQARMMQALNRGYTRPAAEDSPASRAVLGGLSPNVALSPAARHDAKRQARLDLRLDGALL